MHEDRDSRNTSCSSAAAAAEHLSLWCFDSRDQGWSGRDLDRYRLVELLPARYVPLRAREPGHPIPDLQNVRTVLGR